jgi:hypothetical protein
LPDLIGGRYRIVSRLGVGGMGVVYKATDIQLNRAVAVKALEDSRLLVLSSAGKLRAEALAAASLDHPYICKVYELVETPGDTFLVMEFVEGETLASVLSAAAARAHARSGAKSPNGQRPRGLVLRRQAGQRDDHAERYIKLLDFGVAGADIEHPGDDANGVAGGDLHLARRISARAGRRPAGHGADLFSLGVLLYGV